MKRGAVIFSATADGDFEQSRLPDRYTHKDWMVERATNLERAEFKLCLIIDVVMVGMAGLIVLLLGALN